MNLRCLRWKKFLHQRLKKQNQVEGRIHISAMHMESKYLLIDHYWANVSKIKDEEGKPKLGNFCALALCVLTLSDNNEDPERGFSIDATLLRLHASTMKDETVALGLHY